MLKIVGLAEYDGQIERFDDDNYSAPICSIRVGRKRHHSEPDAVWRTEAPPERFAESSLFYIWVRRSDGSVRDIEFVGIRKDCIEFVDDDFAFLDEGAHSLPIVDLQPWEGLDVKTSGVRVGHRPRMIRVHGEGLSLQPGVPSGSTEDRISLFLGAGWALA